MRKITNFTNNKDPAEANQRPSLACERILFCALDSCINKLNKCALFIEENDKPAHNKLMIKVSRVAGAFSSSGNRGARVCVSPISFSYRGSFCADAICSRSNYSTSYRVAHQLSPSAVFRGNFTTTVARGAAFGVVTLRLYDLLAVCYFFSSEKQFLYENRSRYGG